MSGLVSIRDLSKSDVERLLHSAERMEKDLYNMHESHEGQMAATLFFEPSTRTHLSFQTASQRLGMNVIPYNHEHSSSKKGETLTDTIKIVDGYADLIVIRHPMEGAARLAADVAEAPVINAGDGGNQHPTQTLIDLYTIRKAKAKIGGLDVRLAGDLKHARAMRSLLYGLGMFGAKVTLMAPPGLEMDEAVVEETREKFKADITAGSALDVEGDHAVEDQVRLTLGQYLQVAVVQLRRGQVAQMLFDEGPRAGFAASLVLELACERGSRFVSRNNKV